MTTQNITLSLPKDTLLKVKLLAVRRGTSVSWRLAGELEKLVAQDEAYEQAQRRAADRPDLGTKGHITIGRDGAPSSHSRLRDGCMEDVRDKYLGRSAVSGVWRRSSK